MDIPENQLTERVENVWLDSSCRTLQACLDKVVEKCERELSRIFDDNHMDGMEIKAGLLVRRKKGHRTEWVIEL